MSLTQIEEINDFDELEIIAICVNCDFRKVISTQPVDGVEDDVEDGEGEDEDGEIVEQRESDSIEHIRDLYFPKPLRDIHQKGLDELRQRQMDDLKRTFKRLRNL